jgi:Arc/MetJ-type ribon-helix-helix transcriptional regulator
MMSDRGDMMATTRKTFRLPKQLQATLRRLAKSRGQSESEVVRTAIEKLAAAERPRDSCYDLFKKAGVIGMLKDGPPDLSTNPKYLEGLGRD